MNKNILVTGSKGQLGSEIADIAEKFPSLNFVFTDVDELDLTDSKAIEDIFTENEFDACINCAAYTAVDKAEDEQDLAMLINNTAVEYLAKACENHNCLLVHVSTDYVFSGKHYKPYKEDDPVSPDSFYGQSKLMGEEAALSNCEKSVVIRTSWLYSSFGNNFVKTMCRLGNERDTLGVVVDQIGTPTYAADLAFAILSIVEKYDDTFKKQIYHFSNEGAISWYDFAIAIMKIEAIECKVHPIESKDFPAKANRPFYSVLNKAKIKEHYNLEIPYWEDSLKIMLEKIS